MASRKELKKELHSIINIMSEELYIRFIIKSYEAKRERVNELWTNLFDFKKDILSRISNIYGKNDSKAVKAYFKQINSEIDAKIDEFDKELSEIDK